MSEHIRLWRSLLGMCWRSFRARTLVVLALLVVEMLAFAAISLGLRYLIDGVLRDDRATVAVGAAMAGVAYAVTHTLLRVRSNLRIHLVERVGLVAIDAGILRMTADIETTEHLERSDYLDRVALVRGQGWTIVDSAWAAVETAVFAVQLVISLVLLASVSPWLTAMVPVAAIPLWLSRVGRRRAAPFELAAAEPLRLQRHLFEMCHRPDAAKEIRVAGSGPELIRRQSTHWHAMMRMRFRARMTVALFTVAGWGAFTASYIAGLVFVARLVAEGHGTVGDMAMSITLASQLRGQIENIVNRSGQALESSTVIEPYLWLREYASQAVGDATGKAPAVLREGIVLQDVDFTYPGARKPALRQVSARLRAGSIVAVVGEYGSGKSTLVKLLAKMYRPDAGAILVDGTDLAELDTTAWRSGLAAAFQDFGRYQTTLKEAVGLGDPGLLHDDDAVRRAVTDADADKVVARLPDGLDTQLGLMFDGTELSEGQWQKIALARACMRPVPLLFVLDEPTASLDAPSEHEIFLGYVRRARALAAASGAVTVIVSHRFSTIAMADHILVMRDGRIAESGDHRTLIRNGGLYSELYQLHESAYSNGPRARAI